MAHFINCKIEKPQFLKALIATCPEPHLSTKESAPRSVEEGTETDSLRTI